MAASIVAKRISQKFQTQNAICRLRNGSLRVLNRDKLNQKICARIRRDRDILLDQRRDVAEAELRRIAADVLEDEWRNVKTSLPLPDSLDIDQELLLEEELEREALLQYEEWLQQEVDHILSSDETNEEIPLVCPVCCRQCFQFSRTSIQCGQCRIPFRNTKTTATLRDDVNMNLIDHNAGCRYHPQFANIPDSGGNNNLIILCHSCSYFNVIL